jgi:hypothetical protein
MLIQKLLNTIGRRSCTHQYRQIPMMNVVDVDVPGNGKIICFRRDLLGLQYYSDVDIHSN